MGDHSIAAQDEDIFLGIQQFHDRFLAFLNFVGYFIVYIPILHKLIFVCFHFAMQIDFVFFYRFIDRSPFSLPIRLCHFSVWFIPLFSWLFFFVHLVLASYHATVLIQICFCCPQ